MKKYDKKKKIWGEYSNLSWNFIPKFLDFYKKNGKVIILVRDPRAILSSFKKITFLKNALYLNAIFNWLDLMFFLRNFNNLEKKVYIPTFEKLHKNSEKELKKICKFLNVKFNKKMSSNKEHQKLNPKKIKINISSFTKKKVYGFDKKRINHWKDNLSNWEIYMCDKLCGKYYKNFNYNKINFKSSEKKKFNLIINKTLKNNSYIMKLYDKYLKTGKGTDTYPIDPINPKNWSDPKNPFEKFINTPNYLKYLRDVSKIKKKYLL